MFVLSLKHSARKGLTIVRPINDLSIGKVNGDTFQLIFCKSTVDNEYMI